MSNHISKILQSLRNEYVIIGLTGAVGSGCTESAKFLSSNRTDITSYLDGKNVVDSPFQENSRISIMKTVNAHNEWKNFYHIKVSNILFFLLIWSLKKKNLQNLKDEIIIEHNNEKICLKDILKDNTDTSLIVNTCTQLYKNLKAAKKRQWEHNKLTKKLLKKLDVFIETNVDKEDEKYTVLFQKIGLELREKGYILQGINLLEKFKYPDIGDSPVLLIAKITREIIKLIDHEESSKTKHKYYVIDALRNIFEIEFFKNRYESFYLFSILAEPKTRENRLLHDFKFQKSDIKTLNDFEQNSTGVSAQSINACIGKGDVFIQNNGDINNLRYQLIKYVILIRNPGVFTPSDDERFMQLAFTARYNSGCISRQVGAVVVGKDGYVRGLGWNDVPEGHTSCIYRTPKELLSNSGKNIKFSQYERTQEFTDILESLDEKVKSQPYCFKDHRNKIEKNNEVKKFLEDESFKAGFEDIESSEFKKLVKNTIFKSSFKNPTRERALHAEENAFLQVSKSGGQPIVGGTLYTTDSPCQLCAKKAMQLKVSRIVYIDAYPDISTSHTLQAGTEKNDNPKFNMFSGAIGKAYFKLYIPIIGIKDMFKEINK